MAGKRSFYEMIGVARDADQPGIDAGYALVMVRLAEDVRRGASGASIESQLVRDGYKILSDVGLRSRYDAKLAADEARVKLVFFPEDAGARRKLGIESLIFAVLATIFCYVVYWQLNRKIGEVRVDYAVEVARKQMLQNAPKVIEVPAASQDAGVVNGASHSEPASKGGAEKSGP